MRLHSNNRPSRESAFTLAEVIVSVFVLTTMAVALYGGFSTGFMIIDAARQDLRATQIMMQKAEAIRLCPWSSLTNCPITFSERYDPIGSANGVAGGTLYSGVVTTNIATPIPDTAAYKSNMTMVTISLFWTNNYGQRAIVHSRSSQTLVARYGLQNYMWGKP
jgi:Tfp pilus assembly protein PilV